MNSRNQPSRPPPGQLIDIGGLRLHALTAGEGSPAVILEPGLGGFALQYQRIFPTLAVFTRVLAYDRAGQAWSDASRLPRTPQQLGNELRALLGKLNIQPPYILVGHSFGGLLVRLYAAAYPNEVSGLVLIDSSDVGQYDAFKDNQKIERQMAAGVGAMKILSRLGLGRWLTRLSLGAAAKTMSKEMLDAFLDIASYPGHQEATLAEFRQQHHYFGPQSQVPESLGSIPAVVITAGKSVSGRQKTGGMTLDEINAQHQRMQSELAATAARGKHVVIPEAAHLSILTQPEYAGQVVELIRELVEQVRAN